MGSPKFGKPYRLVYEVSETIRGIMFPVCPEPKTTITALKDDPGLILPRIKSRNEDYHRSLLLAEADKALAAFPNEGNK